MLALSGNSEVFPTNAREAKVQAIRMGALDLQSDGHRTKMKLSFVACRPHVADMIHLLRYDSLAKTSSIHHIDQKKRSS